MQPTSSNVLQAGEPSPSALMVATLRAAHQLLDEPNILNDPIALSILGAQNEAALRGDPFIYNDPFTRGVRASLAVRSRFVEDELSRAVTTGVRQYVLLGAGLDTFAYRNPHADEGLCVFEVDHPSTQRWKQQLLADAGIPLPDRLTFVPTDFEHGTLAQTLSEAGFCSDRAACFSWMGVTMYLTTAAVMETLSFVAKLPSGSSIAFDYHVPPPMLNPIDKMLHEFLATHLETRGEPWVSNFDPALFREQISELGFAEIEDSGPDQLNSRYCARRKDGLRTDGCLRLICARVM